MNNTFKAKHQLNTLGLICPEPIMLLHKTIRTADAGEIIHIIANDPATTRDIPNFCRHLGHNLLAQEQQINPNKLANPDPYANVYHYWVQKKLT
ncbi:SirA family protein [Moraxella macacae 0408225]|uniref:SirA family protein n=1 Tax=Moraxella macacae 0408225 TaxID=1230338 RepID=L2F829_9GAMM|nr:sulfurtransferase TusA [Moraxella macacae]ELA09224.1 SirA family protein [Moraxella macacae 0408225]